LASEIKEKIKKQEEHLLTLKNEEMEIEGVLPANKIFNTCVNISDSVMLLEENNILILKEKDLSKFTNFLPK